MYRTESLSARGLVIETLRHPLRSHAKWTLRMSAAAGDKANQASFEATIEVPHSGHLGSVSQVKL